MRIISMLVALPLLWNTLVPSYHAMAAEIASTDETKTNFQLQENIILTGGIAKNGLYGRFGSPLMFPGYEPVRSEDEVAREKTLEKYKNKLNKAVFPKGKFTINASAYTAAADECGKSDGITASGLKVKEKRTIACPSSFPLGTKMSIDGYGTYVCEDRGGAIKGNHVDIYVKTKKEAFAFGRRSLLAEVIN
jgi:3D (Asp-Asp-Asp) domain-containing protein